MINLQVQGFAGKGTRMVVRASEPVPFWRFDIYDRDGLRCGALFLAFAALAVFNVLHHVPWRDELQALLIAQSSTGPISLFHNLAYEGHPGLWHAILMIALEIVRGPDALKLAQVPIAVSILGLLWFRSPFDMIEKILLSSGYFFVFEYTAIARGYGLGVLLFLAFLTWRKRPIAWLFLGLAANISIHFGVLAGICSVLLFRSGNRSKWGIASTAGLAVVAAVTAYPASDVMSSVHPVSLSEHFRLSLTRLSGALFPLGYEKDLASGIFGSRLGDIFRALLSIGIIIGGVFSLRSHSPLQIAFLTICVALLLIGTFLFAGYDRHYGIVWIALIGFHWIAREERPRPPDPIFRYWALVSAFSSLFVALPVMVGPFSGSAQAAAWVNKNARDATIAALPAVSGLPVTADSGKPTFNLHAARWNTFVQWNYPSYEKASATDVARWIQNAPSGQLLLMTMEGAGLAPLPQLRSALSRYHTGLDLVGRFPGKEETYLLYRVRRIGAASHSPDGLRLSTNGTTRLRHP